MIKSYAASNRIQSVIAAIGSPPKRSRVASTAQRIPAPSNAT